MECKKEMLQLYAVTDRAWEVKGNFLEQIEEALKGGITCLQLREKEMKENEFLEEALKVKKICEKYNTPLIINDNVNVAIKCRADGIHVGQNDMSVSEIKKIIPNSMIVGVSVQTLEQALEAEKSGANYLGVGAVFSTNTKLDATVLQREELRKICENTTIPTVAIGGIKKDNMKNLIGTGIDGVALVSAIFSVDDIKKECEDLLNLSKQYFK
ncbi:MAG: thiamine phosphate synthase [Fusobacterium sp.]|nr:thiamine phosphate synthase [Fusobacterium sp.]